MSKYYVHEESKEVEFLDGNDCIVLSFEEVIKAGKECESLLLLESGEPDVQGMFGQEHDDLFDKLKI